MVLYMVVMDWVKQSATSSPIEESESERQSWMVFSGMVFPAVDDE